MYTTRWRRYRSMQKRNNKHTQTQSKQKYNPDKEEYSKLLNSDNKAMGISHLRADHEL